MPLRLGLGVRHPGSMFLSEVKRKAHPGHASSFLSSIAPKPSSPASSLTSLAVNRPFHPTHLSASELLPAAATFRPDSRMPTRGATELGKDQRHNLHLRKRRQLKSQARQKEQLKRSLAATNPKIRRQVDKQDALKTLKKHRNVQIIKKK